jgi:hypothetical protein
MHRHDKRMRVLESYALTAGRRTLPGLVALLETGQLSMNDLTDEELERIIAGAPGEDTIDVRRLSDDQLTAILNGGHP